MANQYRWQQWQRDDSGYRQCVDEATEHPNRQQVSQKSDMSTGVPSTPPAH
jgi:hypothetical protein